MSENCTHNCSTCGESCKSRTAEQTSFLEPLNPASSVKKVIGVVSGKGGTYPAWGRNWHKTLSTSVPRTELSVHARS